MFSNLDLLPGPTPWAARGLQGAEPTPDMGTMSLTSLPPEGTNAVRVCRESNDCLIHSPANYLTNFGNVKF